MRLRVLVTGAGGLIGSILGTQLGDVYELRGLDVRRAASMPSRRLSLRWNAIAARAFTGFDAVIHLAASSKHQEAWRTIYRNNVRNEWNVFDAARRAGVKRVIYASSNHVTGGYERDEPYASIVAGRYDGLVPAEVPKITVDMSVRPDGAYGAAKVMGEAVGRYHSDTYGLSVICLRIGHVNADSAPKNPRHHAVLLTARDLVQLVERGLEAPADLKFATFYGVSDNVWRIWDIDPAKTLIGYEPQDGFGPWPG